MNIIQASTPYYTVARGKHNPLGIVLHDTETTVPVPPHTQGSWHYEIGRHGEIWQYVPDLDYAWHVRATDEWRPSWFIWRDNRVSEANSCTLGIELVSAAVYRNQGEPYTEAQYEATRELLAALYQRYGELPIVTHGSMQLDRTDPVALDFERCGLHRSNDVDGYYFAQEEADDVSPEDQAVLDIIHGLNANASSIEGWINEIGYLKDRVAELEGMIAKHVPTEEVVAQRVEVVLPSGRRDGYIPES